MKIRKQTRKELNLTQQEMSVLLNVSRSQLAMYELGLRELSTIGLHRDSQAGRFLTALEMETGEPKKFRKLKDLN
ncbi:MAG: helix-turn-helix transcriptional regulator [Flavobacterium sp. JAD_PAG50586_2]|nr:MAG: helix-turn-helix transcriptional regulator [Flavobacterium sp. JAD_PAG50586_2]